MTDVTILTKIKIGLGGPHSTVLAQSNGAEIRRRMEPYISDIKSGVVIESEKDEDVLIIVSPEKDQTPALKKWYAILEALALGPLDKKDFAVRMRQAALDAIRFVGSHCTPPEVPEDWPTKVYEWIQANKPDALKNESLYGIYPLEETVNEAQKQLGYLAPT